MSNDLEGVEAVHFLGLERFRNFLEKEAELRSGIIAVKVLHDSAQDEERLLSLVGNVGTSEVSAHAMRFSVSVREIEGEGQYQISVGCSAGPLSGDGGAWRVAFGHDGEVVSFVRTALWRA